MIIKLGGSAITEKNKFKVPKLKTLSLIAKEISLIRNKKNIKMILVSGGGSFGHPLAKKYGIHMGLSDEESLLGVSETIDSMRELSLIICGKLREEGVPCIAIQPSAIATNRKSKLTHFYIDTIKNFLSLNTVPLLWGDVVFDEEMGVSILSGDEITSRLAIELNANKVVFGLEVDGLYSDLRNKKLVKVVNDENINEVFSLAGDSDNLDVTGGMMRKIKEALNIYENGIPIYLVNITQPYNLYKVVINNENIGTLIYKKAKQ